MSYRANIYNVMIASPSDVTQERELTRKIIHEWNYVNSMKEKIALIPLGWETHSSPEMGDPAQKIINRQVLEHSDLLIGIFWTRLGTPTNDFKSGTVEEIEEHIAKKKPTMLYFSTAPASPETIDQKQIDELKKFRTECESRGLIEKYNSLADFYTKFSRHLAQKINEHTYFKKEESQDSTQENSAFTVNYESLSKPQIPQLTDEAKQLLIEASKDPSGQILKLRFIGQSLVIQTNSQTFGGNTPKENAAWEHGINELCSFGLLQERGYKGEVFSLTHEGYQIAEYLFQH